MPREQEPRFIDDLTDPTPRSGGPGAGTVGRMKLNTCDVKDEDFSPTAKWQSQDAREESKPVFNPEAEQATRDVVAQAETLALREAETARLAALQYDSKGRPLDGNAGYSRTEEVLKETDTFRIIRSSDGTVRTDLIKRK